MTDYIMLPRAMLDGIPSALHRGIFLSMLERADEQGQLTISVRGFADEIGVNYQAMRTLLRKLESMCIITINSTNSATIITLNGIPSIMKPCMKNPKPIVFDKPQYGEIRQYVMDKGRGWDEGYVYGIEFGRFVKIGYTQYPHERFMSLRNKIPKENNVPVGRMVLSPPCLNYKALECAAHSTFATARYETTELFGVGFDDVVKLFNTLRYNCRNV